MVYVGLEFGSWFEIPWDSPCYQAIRGVNPVLQIIFTFSQMYFVFMNSRVRECYKPFSNFSNILNFSLLSQLSLLVQSRVKQLLPINHRIFFILAEKEIKHFPFSAQHSPVQMFCSVWSNAHRRDKYLRLDQNRLQGRNQGHCGLQSCSRRRSL